MLNGVIITQGDIPGYLLLQRGFVGLGVCFFTYLLVGQLFSSSLLRELGGSGSSLDLGLWNENLLSGDNSLGRC